VIVPEVIAKIRRLYFAEHWKIETIAAQLGLHHETVRRAIGSDAFNRAKREESQSPDHTLPGLYQAHTEGVPTTARDADIPDDSCARI
jgi:hypothetical protein